MISDIEKVIDDTEYFEPKFIDRLNPKEKEIMQAFYKRQEEYKQNRSKYNIGNSLAEPMSGYDQVRLNS